MLPLLAALVLAGCEDKGITSPDPDPVDPDAVRPLVIHVLDVEGGDATMIVNGKSRVIIDGGTNATRFAAHLDAFELNDSGLDAVVLSHTHADHSSGLAELFRTDRNIAIDLFFDNTSLSSPSTATDAVRDSARAREARGELVYRDAADPCGDGSAICTLKLDGEARMHVMRPFPDHGTNVDNGSVPVKLVGPDSASFTMWLAGDARQSAIDWFGSDSGYHASPGMRVNLLKGQEHGDCRALPRSLLDLTQPDAVTFSLYGENLNGRVHNQTKARVLDAGAKWYRTDVNGTIKITSPGTPGGGYSIDPGAGSENLDGAADADSESPGCT